MIPGKILTRLAKFQGIVSVNDFWFPRRLHELHEVLLSSARSLRYFRFQGDIAIWVLRKLRIHTVPTRTGSTFARDSIGNS